MPLAGGLTSPSLFPQVNIGSTKGSCRDKQVSGERECREEAGPLGRVPKSLRKEAWPCPGSRSLGGERQPFLGFLA